MFSSLKKFIFRNLFNFVEVSDIFQNTKIFTSGKKTRLLTIYKDIKCFDLFYSNIDHSSEVKWTYISRFRSRTPIPSKITADNYIIDFSKDIETIIDKNKYSIILNPKDVSKLNDNDIIRNLILRQLIELQFLKEEVSQSLMKLKKTTISNMLISLYAHHKQLNFNLNDFSIKSIHKQNKTTTIEQLIKSISSLTA